MKNYPWDTRIAWAVCMAESGGDVYAANRKDLHKDGRGNVICVGSFGLMQIGCIHGGEIFDPVENIAKGWAVYSSRAKWDSDPWRAWGAYTDGRYLKYL